MIRSAFLVVLITTAIDNIDTDLSLNLCNRALWTLRGVSEGPASGNAMWMVEFYAPWCSHCMRSVPQFKTAAMQLDGQVEFGAVNCDKASPICNEWGIQSFPKFLLFSPMYRWSEEYPKARLKELGKSKDELGSDITIWVRYVLISYSKFNDLILNLHGVTVFVSRGHLPIFQAGRAEMLSGAVGNESPGEILSHNGVWVLLLIASHDAARCEPCNDAKPNGMHSIVLQIQGFNNNSRLL